MEWNRNVCAYFNRFVLERETKKNKQINLKNEMDEEANE